ncbi:tetratricopeptide (TPR) repeat protein [Ereboglobus sp. PH5-5]|uniref:tetratricopeptide repeat protein n=1 Tax=Ereboglobus sp. PH5-5 TaxID=2940529 RepID=UPI0024059F6D|nr:hypothetical protein [Ereboglobus sp. PH5-5]MDF9832108.1 tetratricopeptide (TPR) repeat protein [Ereboglobus sp. PH5-5]
MNRETLLKQIEQWHADGNHQEIEDAVRALPEVGRDFDLSCMLARALNNLSRYGDALEILESVRDQGRDDALWHYRVAYSLYYLDREADSIPHFERAIALGDDHPDTYQMLLWAKKAAKQHLDAKPEGKNTDGEARTAFVAKAIATLELNMRLQPNARTMRLEDGLDLMLRDKGLGYVNGGGSQLSPEGEITSCDIEIKLAEDSPEIIETILSIAKKLDIAKGSKLKYRALAGGTEVEYPIGKLEGFAVYINHANQPPEVWQKHNVNEVADELHRLLGNNGTLVFSHWNGPKEVALYFYGEGGADAMQAKAKPFLDTHPLCQNCRIVRLA